MKKFSILHYIYYRFYKLSVYTEKHWGKSLQMPEWAAAITFSIFILLNIAFIVISLYRFYNIDIEVTPTSGIATMVLLYIVNYILFIHKNKFLAIEAYFDKQTKNKLKVKSAFFFTYIIMTISLFVICFIK